MIRKASLKVAAASGALVLGGAVAAAAVTTPDEADDGLTKAAEQTGFELPASQENHPTNDDHPGAPPQGTSEVDGSSEHLQHGGERPQNHGWYVSQVAQDDSLSGRAKGEAVSTMAKGDAGKPDHAGSPEEPELEERSAPPVETPNAGGTGTADEASDGSSETGTSEASDPAAQGSSNASSNRP